MRSALAVALVVVGAACGRAPEPIVVFAAASLADVAEAAARRVEVDQGVPVVVSIGATSTLAHQVRRGAPADVLLAADPRWLDWLESHGAALHDRRVLATGTLVVVGPASAPGPSTRAAILGAGRLAMGDPAHVPAGRYARRALQQAGLWEEVRARVVPQADVRAALAAVETGAADLAIVYATDARLSDRVRVLGALPLREPIRFEGALVGGDRGAAVLAALADAEGRRQWGAAGFGPPTP